MKQSNNYEFNMKRKNDAYYTPVWLVNELLARRIEYGIKGSILEPCCGNGAISKPLTTIKFYSGLGVNAITKVVTNDVDENVVADIHEKAQELLPQVKGSFDWIIANPPLDQAHEIVPLAYESARTGIAMLLRLTYLEPARMLQNNFEENVDYVLLQKREWTVECLLKHPPTNLIINKRISSTGEGKSNNETTAWFIWNKNQSTTNINFIY